MIEVIHIRIGKIHHHLPQTLWDEMRVEMHNKYSCDVVFKTTNDKDTKMNIDGDLDINECIDCQDIFSKHLDKFTSKK